MNIINSLYFVCACISASLPTIRGNLLEFIAFLHWMNLNLNFAIVSADLSKNLHYYEAIHVDDVVHRVVKRGTKQSYHPFNVIKEVEFKALGRHFRIILHPQRDVLHSNFKAYSVDGEGNEKVVHFGWFNNVFIVD